MRLRGEAEPLNVALVLSRTAEAADADNPFDEYIPLQEALSAALSRPLAIEACYPQQVFAGLKEAWYDFVVLTPVQYAELVRSSHPNVPLDVLVTAVDKQSRPSRAAVLVAAQGGPVSTVSAVRGHRVAFGPEGDALTHHAALMLLADAGVRAVDLAKERTVGVRGAELLHLPRATEVLRAVTTGAVIAGFIDELEWERFVAGPPGSGPRPEQLRVVARTVALPPRLVLVSAQVPREVRRLARQALLRFGRERPEIFDPLTIGGFVDPEVDALLACDQLLDYDLPTAGPLD